MNGAILEYVKFVTLGDRLSNCDQTYILRIVSKLTCLLTLLMALIC